MLIRYLVAAIAPLVMAVAARPACGLSTEDRDSSAALVRAAGMRASAAILEQISARELPGGLTVRQFLKQTDREDRFGQLISQAEQVGAPRWLEDNTCQVQMRLPSAPVREMLQRLAAEAGAASPLAPEQIARATAAWPASFSATGSVMSSRDVMRLRTSLSGRWAAVSDAGRWKALAAAMDDAGRKAVESLRTIRLNEQHTLGDLMEKRPVEQSLREWLAAQPVGRIEFQEDLAVEVALVVSPQDLLARLRESLAAADAAVPADEQAWRRAGREIAARLAAPVGRASAVADVLQPEAAAVGEVAASREPPWAYDSVEVRGSALHAGSALKTARTAEADAVNKLRARVENLPLDGEGNTVGAAAAANARIAAVVDEALQRARIVATEYAHDGTVTVRLSLDLRHLWEAMQKK